MSRVCVGVVAGAHGVRGLVRIRSFTDMPEDIAAYGPLSDQSGSRHWVIAVQGRSKDALLARLDGVESREDAIALKGLRLFVSREALPPPADADSFYHADLIGLQARRRDGRPVGTVKAVHNFGAGDVLEINLTGGRSADLPFTHQAVPEIDLSGGFVLIEPPPGLWDDEEQEDRKRSKEGTGKENPRKTGRKRTKNQ